MDTALNPRVQTEGDLVYLFGPASPSREGLDLLIHEHATSSDLNSLRQKEKKRNEVFRQEEEEHLQSLTGSL